jgi:hypothetical protein
VAQLQEREPQAAWLQLPYGEGQQGLQKQHDTLNAGGSIGLRSRLRQALPPLSHLCPFGRIPGLTGDICALLVGSCDG